MERSAFGAPAVMTSSEAMTLGHALRELWHMTYRGKPGEIAADLQLCGTFFNPLTRGQTLRARLALLEPTPAALYRKIKDLEPPLVYPAGDGIYLVGVEGRLLIDAIERSEVGSVVVISDSAVAEMEHAALQVYRGWATARISQVLELRSGNGREVMQAIAVGIALALLVNRSDTPERAIVGESRETTDGKDLNRAVFTGAEAFAANLSERGKGRSVDEQKLKSGYGLSEARRRLAHRLVIVRPKSGGSGMIYLPAGYRDEIVRFLGRDLARRPSLTRARLESSFDILVTAYREMAENLAHRSMVFERAGDTADLREDLLAAFDDSRQQGDE